MLALFDNLPTEIVTKAKKCSVDLSQALKRCENSYGKSNCEKISHVAIQTKCEDKFERIGCCHCAMACPTGFVKQEYHCIRPKIVDVTNGSCPEGSSRLGSLGCFKECPNGWHNEGERCRIPAVYRMAQPFFYAIGDSVIQSDE